MKTRKPLLKPVWLLLLLMVIPVFLRAQTTSNPFQQLMIVVNTVTGEKATLSLKAVESIWFENGQMKILKRDATQYSFSFASVRSVNFDWMDLTDVREVRESLMNRLSVYPNPAVEVLNLNVESLQNELVTIQILNLQGKVLIQENLTLTEGRNCNSISVGTLNKGLYLLRMIRGTQPVTIKFIKN